MGSVDAGTWHARPVRSAALVAVSALPGIVAVGCGGASGPAASTPATTSTAAPRPPVRSAEHDARERAPVRPATEPDGSPIAPEPQGTEPDKGSPGADEPSGGKVDVSIRNGRFRPATMRVAVGQIVVWTDDDRVAHTVRATGGGLPRSGLIPAGGRFEYTALRPGRLHYRCVIHPDMTGRLVVRP